MVAGLVLGAVAANVVSKKAGEMLPAVGSSTPARIFIKVDLPQPLAPIRP